MRWRRQRLRPLPALFAAAVAVVCCVLLAAQRRAAPMMAQLRSLDRCRR
eukprot:gene7332-3333_t